MNTPDSPNKWKTGKGRHAWSPQRVHFSHRCFKKIPWNIVRRHWFRSGQTLSPARKKTTEMKVLVIISGSFWSLTPSFDLQELVPGGFVCGGHRSWDCTWHHFSPLTRHRSRSKDWTLLLSGGLDDMEVLRVLRQEPEGLQVEDGTRWRFFSQKHAAIRKSIGWIELFSVFFGFNILWSIWRSKRQRCKMYYNPLGYQGERPSGELIDVSTVAVASSRPALVLQGPDLSSSLDWNLFHQMGCCADFGPWPSGSLEYQIRLGKEEPDWPVVPSNITHAHTPDSAGIWIWEPSFVARLLSRSAKRKDTLFVQWELIGNFLLVGGFKGGVKHLWLYKNNDIYCINVYIYIYICIIYIYAQVCVWKNECTCFLPSTGVVRLQRAVSARFATSGAPGAFDQGCRPVLHHPAEGSHPERPQQGWQEIRSLGNSHCLVDENEHVFFFFFWGGVLEFDTSNWTD